MKEIHLAHGRGTCLVDDEDYEWLSQYSWRLAHAGYPQASVDRRQQNMHRVILGLSGRVCADHINTNKLDNRRCNLRLCTQSQNARNRSKGVLFKGRPTHSIYKGVTRARTKREGWEASISPQHKKRYLGTYRTQEEAAEAYNQAATVHFGEFARLNEIPLTNSGSSKCLAVAE